MSKFPLVLFGVAAVMSLVGCANKGGYVQMHGEASLPPSDLSILKGVYEYRNGSEANETIRIVQVNGGKVPSQFGVAEGANIVSLLPGQHDVKVLWVHARGEMNYYTYSTLRIDARPNCIYQFYSKIAVLRQEVYLGAISSPATKVGNQNCGSGILERG